MTNKVNVENVVARLLGQVNEEKLIKIGRDNGEAIGNFDIIKSTADDINRRSTDIKATWENVWVTHNEENLYFNINNNGCYSFSNNGLGVICSAIGVPSQYIKKCMGENQFYLACQNINNWIDLMPKQKEMMYRITDDRVFGMVSNKYTVFDDHEVLEATNGILSPYHNYAVKDYSISPELMKLRIISRDKININGEELSFGFDIKNSRVGRASCEIAILIYRWICGNGCIFGGGKGFIFSKRHVAINREQYITEFTDMLDKSPDTIEYIKKKVEEAQELTLNSNTIQNLIDKFKAENIVNSKYLAGKIEQVMDEKYTRTAWGFTNAITEIAQDYSVDTREKLEQFAGKILLTKTA